MTEKSKNRLVDIDYVRAVAIILVVVGHWQVEPQPRWWQTIIEMIYSFHMPLFLAMSGYLYMYTKKPGQSYVRFLTSKARRLMVPYFFTSVIIITIKLLTQGSMHVEHPVGIMTYVEIFYKPSAGAFLWFIWTLWWMFMIVPLFSTRRMRALLFVVLLIAAYLPWDATRVFGLVNTQRFAVYFVAGVLLYDFKDVIFEHVAPRALVLFGLFVLLEIMYLSGFGRLLYVIPYLAIVSIILVARSYSHFISGGFSRFLIAVSSASYMIYLFHTTFEGFVKSALVRFIGGSELMYAAVAIIAVAAGTFVPMWLYSKVLNRYKLTRFMFGL